MKRNLLAPLLAFGLLSCGEAEETTPGGVTQSEQQALDDAAEMLDKANNAADLPRDPEPAAETPAP